MPNDSIVKTVAVALGVCLVCSMMVAGAVVTLRPIQERNIRLDRKRNVLLAAGLLEPGQKADIEALFARLEAEVVDLETGEPVPDADPDAFDPAVLARDAEGVATLPADRDIAGIRRRPNRQVVYFLREDGRLRRVILPVYGKGLWSTMYGLIALGPDLNTVESFGFFAHAETPGLGGEVDNPRWKAQWIGKRVFDASGQPRLEVVKGRVAPDSPEAEYQVDGLSGATLTGRGVTNLLRFWLGEQGYGPLLERLRREERTDHADAAS
ncbi:MAG: Na(+)-translocating NADH-quinone reductase subunit C [Thermogutta sp.]